MKLKTTNILNRRGIYIAFLFLWGCLIQGCIPDPIPKKRSYPRVHYPVKGETVKFESERCPFEFELPDYYHLKFKEKFLDTVPQHPCWVNLDVPDLNGTIYLSYKDVREEKKLIQLVEDAYKLTYKHSQKADFIEPVEINNNHNAYGMIYYVGGDAASPLQFFVTDTTTHFLRGALYFRAHPNADSIAPVVNFIAKDIEQILGSLKWN